MHLAQYARFLRRFRYRDALDAALATRKPEVVIALLAELSQRNGLRIALGGRSEEKLQPLLGFLATYAAHPRCSRLLLPSVDRVLDAYAPAIGASPMVDGCLRRLRDMLLVEIKMMNGLSQLSGCVEPLLTASIANSTRHDE